MPCRLIQKVSVNRLTGFFSLFKFGSLPLYRAVNRCLFFFALRNIGETIIMIFI